MPRKENEYSTRNHPVEWLIFPFNQIKFWNSVLRLLSIENAIDESDQTKKRFEIVIELAHK